MPRSVFLAAVLLCSLATAAVAQEVRVGRLVLSELHMRASIGNSPNTAGYLVVTNPSATPDRLLSASCACASRTELHTVTVRDGVSRMNAAASLPVPARGRLDLGPGGSAHLMVTGLRAPIRNGERVSVTLRFERAGAVTTDFHVLTNPAAAPASARARSGPAHH